MEKLIVEQMEEDGAIILQKIHNVKDQLNQ